MTLGEKVRYLREIEGTLRGMSRAMTQQEVVGAVQKELGKSISQSYLSQIESGARPHLTNSSRNLLARFFKVHPGFLVEDPHGFHTELTSHLRSEEQRLDSWLVEGAEHFHRDPELMEALLEISRHRDSRRCLLLLATILEMPDLLERLQEVLRPDKPREQVRTGMVAKALGERSGDPVAADHGKHAGRPQRGMEPPDRRRG